MGILSNAGICRAGRAGRDGDGERDGVPGAARADIAANWFETRETSGMISENTFLGRAFGAQYCLVTTLPGDFSMSSITIPCSAIVRSRCFCSRK